MTQPVSVAPPSDDADIAAIAPNPLVRFAGMVALAHGGGLILAALQSSLLLLQPLRFVLPLGLEFGLGAAIAYGGARLAGMRGWAAPLALGASMAGLLFSTGWFVYGLLHGLLSLLAMAILPLGLLAIILEALALAPALRADRARERLREKGLDIGG